MNQEHTLSQVIFNHIKLLVIFLILSWLSSPDMGRFQEWWNMYLTLYYSICSICFILYYVSSFWISTQNNWIILRLITTFYLVYTLVIVSLFLYCVGMGTIRISWSIYISLGRSIVDYAECQLLMWYHEYRGHVDVLGSTLYEHYARCPGFVDVSFNASTILGY